MQEATSRNDPTISLFLFHSAVPRSLERLCCTFFFFPFSFTRSFRGKYRIRLFDITLDRWRTITVDDQIPTRHGNPLFVKPKGKELWVVILEKAVAK